MEYLEWNDCAGTKVTLSSERQGYPGEYLYATSVLDKNKVYTVKHIDIDAFISYVELEEVPNERFNTVMFVKLNVKE